jgi:hypothetical protein
MGESVEGHLAQGPQGAFFIPRCMHLLGPGESIGSPNLLRPKVALLVAVFAEVSKNVGLLEEETHRVGEDELACNPRSFLFGGSEEAGETLTDETGDIMAVEVVFLDGGEIGGSGGSSGTVGKVCHASFHF